MEAETPAITLSQVARAMFYLVTPNETSFQRVEEVPDFVDKATPIFIGMLVLELVLGWVKTGSLVIRINDGVTSVSAGLLSRLPLLFLRGLELSGYIYIWNNHRLLDLPWDSQWTWWLAFLGVDLAYYWFHRFSHELNILWAAHQTHHSSEDYNLSTALRQSSTQQFASWVIRHLGPLEWVMNTPSHHRVHHGRNHYCIDKNYAGTLIIWDRIFGTFAPEGEKVVYGLTKQINSFDPINVQVDVKEVPYNPTLPLVLQAYVILQFLLLLAVYTDVMAMKLVLSQQTLLLLAGYIIFTLTSLGLIIDLRPKAAVVEMFRCASLLGLYRFGYVKVAVLSMPFEVFICLSVLYWALQPLRKLANGKSKRH